MRLTILILMLTSPVVRIGSALTSLTESFPVSVRIAVLTPVLKERTISMEVKIATKSTLWFNSFRVRGLALRMRLRRTIFGCPVDFGFLIWYARVSLLSTSASEVIIFIYQMMHHNIWILV
ncbi:unnamed protein product [Hymenolepis diminuta]|uniref:Secreted protein n=1 Tax=Hymenolepis diminuta TaxID=6216 RepID=A0A564XVV9_HYMDI|nr:unnamed protein product [Hymenolepis diminuta]